MRTLIHEQRLAGGDAVDIDGVLFEFVGKGLLDVEQHSVRARMFVASDVGGHRELVRDRDTGFLFRANDPAALEAALEEVLARRDLWPQIRAQARRFVEIERTWSASVARYAEVYRRALNRPGRFQAAPT